MAVRADDVDLARDRDLVLRYQNGDPSAFDELYRRYFGRLHRFCCRHTRDEHEAEEIAQEAFVRALGAMRALEGERRFYPWVTVIARRLCIDQHRKLSRVELTEAPEVGSVLDDLDHLFDAVDHAHVRIAFDQLGPRHREVLELREQDGLSYGQIAERLQVPMTTVEALLHRARKALRREYALAAGEGGRGLLGLPILGWLATRAVSVRDRLGDRWVEIAIGAPVAVGAATAALVLGPVRAPEVVTAQAAPAVLERAEPPRAPSAPVVVAPGDGTVGAVGAASSTTRGTAAGTVTTAASPTTVAPTAAAGPVDVFVGPDGARETDRRADQLPYGVDVGPGTVGFDPGAAVSSAFNAIFGLRNHPADPAAPAGGTP